MPITRASLIQRLSRWDYLGHGTWSDGTPYWGDKTTGPTFGWLHWVCFGYSKSELAEFHQLNPFLSAYQHPRIWTETCGFQLFAGTVDLYGPHLASIPPRVTRHFSIANVNRSETWVAEKFDGLIFGGLKNNDQFLIELPAGPILAVDRKTQSTVHVWPDGFDSFLESKLDQLCDEWSLDDRA